METVEKAKFLPLFQRLSMNINSVEMSKYSVLPYDFHCPTIQKDLIVRLCLECNLYFASKKNVMMHRKNIHPKVKRSELPKRRVKRIITKREDEAMSVISDSCTGEEDVEWLPINEIEVEENENIKIDFNVQKSDTSVTIIKSLDEWLRNEWTIDD